MRLFIALPLAPGLSAKLAELQKRLQSSRAQVAWVAPANIHLTLKFLGEVAEDRLPELTTLLQQTGSQHQALALNFARLGAFPNLRDPRVVWVGCDANPGLLRLQTAIETALAQRHFPPETRNFSPHLTLGRVKRAADLPEYLKPFQDFALGPCQAEKMLLLQSILSPQGARYKVLKEISLGIQDSVSGIQNNT